MALSRPKHIAVKFSLLQNFRGLGVLWTPGNHNELNIGVQLDTYKITRMLISRTTMVSESY